MHGAQHQCGGRWGQWRQQQLQPWPRARIAAPIGGFRDPWPSARPPSPSGRPGARCGAAADPSPPAAPAASAPAVLAARHGDLVWASCVSGKPTVSSAVAEAATSIARQLQQGAAFEPDLALVFATCNYGPQLQDVVRAVRRAAPSVRHVFGCSAFGVLGGSPSGPLEVEGEPGLSLTLASLPGVEVSVMHTLRSSIPSEDAGPEAWCDLVGLTPVEPLQPSPPPSASQSRAEEEEVEEEEEEKQEEEAGGAPGAGQASGGEEWARQASSQGASSSSGSGGGAAAAAAAAEGAGRQEAASFLVLCDPRFQQSKQLLAGLDFAFPNATKVGAVLSQGQQNKRRLMFAWSADGSVQPGTTGWAARQQDRRKQQLAAAAALQPGDQRQQPQEQPPPSPPPPPQQQQQQQQQQRREPAAGGARRAGKKGVFGGLFDSLLSTLADDEQQQQQQQQQTGGRAGQEQQQHQDEGEEQEAEGELGRERGASGSGVFMYGAAVLGLKGPLELEPMTCQGYRTVSDRVWTVGQTSRDGDLILTLVDPDEEGGEVVPLLALYELLLSSGIDAGADPGEWIEDVSEKLAVAIAPDTWTPAARLGVDDFQVSGIAEVWQKTGYVRVDGQARPGYRLRLVLRDERGIRDDLTSKLLGVKRAQLASVLSGQTAPPPLAALLFTDIGRGVSLYETPSYESCAVASYLPVPLAGLFGSAQVSTVNGKAGLYELTSAVAVLRPLAPARGSAAAQRLGVAPPQ